MAMMSLLIFILFPLLSNALTEPSMPENTLPHMQYPKRTREFSVIEGMVYCQSCGNAGSWSLAGAKPLPFAKVGIVCKDHKNRVWFYKAFQADKNGYYYAPIVGMEGVVEDRKKNGIAGCRVHLLSSPDSNCNMLTNINMGITGAGVRKGRTTKKGEAFEVVVYAAPPLAFRPAKCAYDIAH